MLGGGQTGAGNRSRPFEDFAGRIGSASGRFAGRYL